MISARPEGLTYQLSMQDDHVTENEIVVTFTLANTSPKDLWVLTWYTPLEGIKGKIFTMTCNGVEIPYEGRMVKRAAPLEEDYILIKSGETVSAANDLATVFHLSESGTCTVNFRGTIHDVVTCKQDVPRDPEHHEPISVHGNSLTFQLVRNSAA